jgi:hypothetical protein
MDSASPIVRLTGRSGRGSQLRLLAETVVAVQYTLGTGTDSDNRELGAPRTTGVDQGAVEGGR